MLWFAPPRQLNRYVATYDMKHSLAFAISLVLLAASAATNRTNGSHVAQKFRSGIAGRLTDPNGAVVAGATIRIVARSTNAVVIRKSDDRGEYLADLDPDTYDVEADAAGFKKVKRKSIPVLREARSYVDFVLEPKARLTQGTRDREGATEQIVGREAR